MNYLNRRSTYIASFPELLAAILGILIPTTSAVTGIVVAASTLHDLLVWRLVIMHGVVVVLGLVAPLALGPLVSLLIVGSWASSTASLVVHVNKY